MSKYTWDDAVSALGEMLAEDRRLAEEKPGFFDSEQMARHRRLVEEMNKLALRARAGTDLPEMSSELIVALVRVQQEQA